MTCESVSTVDALARYRAETGDFTTRMVERLCPETSPHRQSILGLVHDEGLDTAARFVALALSEALGIGSTAGLPVSAVSRLWWAGAETLDDILDGSYSPDQFGMTPHQAVIASITCGAVLPASVLRAQNYPPALERALCDELARTSLEAADGQYGDVTNSNADVTWPEVIRIYTGKNGSPYARDLVMVSLLASQPSKKTTAWRVFGQLFGLLRQVANDLSRGVETLDEDMANATRTLLLAVAFELAWEPERVLLRRLRAEAVADENARRELIKRMHGSAVTAEYRRRISGVHHKALSLLEYLCAPSAGRSIVEWMLGASTRTAIASLQG